MFVVMYTDDGTEIQTHGFAAQSFRFKGGILNHIVGLLPTFIYNISRFDVTLLSSCNSCYLMWFYSKY